MKPFASTSPPALLSESDDRALHAAIAVNRFGLGDSRIAAAASSDPRGWLRGQIGAADAQRSVDGGRLPSAAEGLRLYADFVRQRRLRRDAAASSASESMSGSEQGPGNELRDLVQGDLRARLTTASMTERPFAERLALFWANHFTVSMAKPSTRGLVGAFEREAIRPHIAGRFEDLLRAAVTHPGMLRYLDNEQSAGPQSMLVARLARRAQRSDGQAGMAPRITGLNENLAREVLELHTLGAAAARDGTYTQADVTAFAALLTGWRVPASAWLGADADTSSAAASPTRFEPAWHQPGEKRVLGKRYGEGADALGEVLTDLARHPSTARFVAHKLARHFVADTPPPSLVDRLALTWRRSDGDLAQVYTTLIDAPETWQRPAGKLKSPEEWVLSCARVLRLSSVAFKRPADGGIALLGQRVQAAPSPAGWPDTAEEWLGPDAVWKRVEWATRLAERVGGQVDARALAESSLGPLLGASTATQIGRAADAPQALALLLLSPEFQRR